MEVFEAVAQPKRREILRLLSGRELSAGEIASRFAVTQPAISQHLKVLKDVGLVSERREGTKRMLSVRAEGLAERVVAEYRRRAGEKGAAYVCAASDGARELTA